jgi:hypothetical protein
MLDVELLAPQMTRALRREEYDRLATIGAFEDERVELIEGVLVKAPLYAASGFSSTGWRTFRSRWSRFFACLVRPGSTLRGFRTEQLRDTRRGIGHVTPKGVGGDPLPHQELVRAAQAAADLA